MTKIGTIDYGIDGSDQYVLLTRSDNQLTAEQAKEWLLSKVYYECGVAGGYFCNVVLAVQAASGPNQVICTIQHRYDN